MFYIDKVGGHIGAPRRASSSRPDVCHCHMAVPSFHLICWLIWRTVMCVVAKPTSMMRDWSLGVLLAGSPAGVGRPLASRKTLPWPEEALRMLHRLILTSSGLSGPLAAELVRGRRSAASKSMAHSDSAVARRWSVAGRKWPSQSRNSELARARGTMWSIPRVRNCARRWTLLVVRRIL